MPVFEGSSLKPTPSGLATNCGLRVIASAVLKSRLAQAEHASLEPTGVFSSQKDQPHRCVFFLLLSIDLPSLRVIISHDRSIESLDDDELYHNWLVMKSWRQLVDHP